MEVFFLTRLQGLEGRERAQRKAHRMCAASERPGPETRSMDAEGRRASP